MNNLIKINDQEYKRVKSLSDLDLDYSQLDSEFKNLINLAASIANTDYSVINLIDNFTQWTVSHYGLGTSQVPREESVCNHTLFAEDYVEILRLDKDPRFMAKDYVTGKLQMKYYLGIPLTTTSGTNIGALCVIDKSEDKSLSATKIAQLKAIAKEVVTRLEHKKQLKESRILFSEAVQTTKKLAHDIRGPLGGIMSLSKLGHEELLQPEDYQSYMGMITESSRNVILLSDEILKSQVVEQLPGQYQISIGELGQKMKALYKPQAYYKSIDLQVWYQKKHKEKMISRDNLFQIIGNLLSNAIKFSPLGGEVKLNLIYEEKPKFLKLQVQDSGCGFSTEKIKEMLYGDSNPSVGSEGETGYGLGLKLVNNLVKEVDGILKIESTLGEGSVFTVEIPQM